MGDDGKLLLSVREAAQLLGVGKGLVYNLCAEGVLPHLRLGRKLLLPRAGLVEWVKRTASLEPADDSVIDLAQASGRGSKGGTP